MSHQASERRRLSLFHNFQWAWRTARRDARGSTRSALFHVAGLSLGIAALVAMVSLGADLNRNVRMQTKALLGADLVIQARQPFTADAQALISSLPGERATFVQFTTMAFFPASQQALFCRVRAIEGKFPFYGDFVTEPAGVIEHFNEGPNIVIDKALVARLGLKVGDKIKLGQREFNIVAVLVASSGESETASLFGPRVGIPLRYLEETGLIQTGSLMIHYSAHKLEGIDADAWVQEHDKALKNARLDCDTAKTREAELGEAMARLNKFLSLAACLALLLGTIGIAGAISYHLRRKRRQIAVLRCIGATSGQVTAVFLIQVLAMTLLAALIGTLLGLAIQFLVPGLLRSFIPFEFAPQFQPRALLISLLWSCGISLMMALVPLSRIRQISPAESLRNEDGTRPFRREILLIYGLILLGWLAFAASQTGSLLTGAYFLLGLILVFAILAFASYGLGKLARWLARPSLPFGIRFGIASLFRPNHQTYLLTLLLGFGVFLLSLLLGVRGLLLEQFRSTMQAERPNFMIFDVQPDQLAGVEQVLQREGFALGSEAPIVPMRIQKIKEKTVVELFESEIPRRMLDREYRSTFRDQLTASEKLVSGQWIGHFQGEASEPIPVSIEDRLAKTFGLSLGDSLQMDIMGVSFQLRVASTRKVDWQSMSPNFFIVFPTGVLEEAPRMHLLTTRVADDAQAARLQSALVSAYGNINCFDLLKFSQDLEKIIAKGALVVAFLAGLCLTTGLLLLASALWTSGKDRIGELALLLTLGAQRGQTLRMALAEYFLLGFFASSVGVLLALIATALLGHFWFELDNPIQPLPFLLPLLGIPLLTVLLGALSRAKIGGSQPLQILKAES